jgi:hypothetical protein
MPVEIKGDGLDLKLYSFALSGDGHLVALWRNEIAVEEVLPGIPQTVTLPGLADHHALGLDVLFGFQQTLVAEVEDSDLVIRDLIVRDYPLLLHLRPLRRLFLPMVVKEEGA